MAACEHFLVLNSGSSSLKAAIFEINASRTALSEEKLPEPIWSTVESADLLSASQADCGNLLTKLIADSKIENCSIQWIAHRIVHGGSELCAASEITKSVETAIEKLAELAPVHNPIATKFISASKVVVPAAKQYAVFDTAFHATLSPSAFTYAIPFDWTKQYGIRRFGFHGINHKYCSQRIREFVAADKASRVIVCHLGNGCSLAAIKDGKSVDTTMGFTPLEGLMMGARSGSIDPGIIFHMCKKGLDPQTIEKALNNDSGLKGVSGISKDMREIQKSLAPTDASATIPGSAGILPASKIPNRNSDLDSRSDSQSELSKSDRAQLAFDCFVHRLVKEIAAMSASAGGIDVLVFTGGIGEHSTETRSDVCQKLEFLGIKLDQSKNNTCTVDGVISSSESKVAVIVIKANEEVSMLKDCIPLLQKQE